MRRLIVVLTVLMVAQLGLPVPSVQAKPACLTEITARVVGQNRIHLMGDASISRVEFTSFINMRVNVLGGRTTDFTWDLPAGTTTLSFEVNRLKLNRYAQVLAVVYDQCGEVIVVPIEAYATTLIDPYPFEFAAVPVKPPAQVPTAR